MLLYEQGRIWWFLKQYKGRKVEKGLETVKKGEAADRFADRVPKIRDGSYFVVEKKEVITIQQLAEKY